MLIMAKTVTYFMGLVLFGLGLLVWFFCECGEGMVLKQREKIIHFFIHWNDK